MKLSVMAFLGLLWLAGCVNPYKEHYLSAVEKWNGPVQARLLPPSESVTLVSSNDMKTDAHRLLQEGYVLLGRSKFTSAVIDEKEALEVGEKIGAWLVLVNHKYDKTITVRVADVITTPDQTTVESHTFEDRHGDLKTVTDTQTVKGTTQVNWVPENIDYYNYAATYWGKTKPSILGLLVKAPSTDPLEPSPNKTGLLVKVVVTNSPAYNAQMQEGDILTAMEGVQLNSVAQFAELVNQNAGKAVNLEFIRDGQAQQITITLASGS